MQINHDPDEWELTYERHICAFHELNPGKPFAGCTCSGGYSSRRRAAHQIADIKARRRREYEDRVLAEADAIRARRPKSK